MVFIAIMARVRVEVAFHPVKVQLGYTFWNAHTCMLGGVAGHRSQVWPVAF